MSRGTVPEIVGREWRRVIADMRQEWEPGQHVTIIAPTHQGKTTVLCSLLNDCGRKYVLALDPKGGDSTLAGLGWSRIDRLPDPDPWYRFWHKDIYERMADGEPYRRIVGRIVHTKRELDALKVDLRHTLDRSFELGGFTVAVDEFQLLAAKSMMDLGTEVERLLIAARDKGVSVITLFQAPRWVPRAAVDQSEYCFVGLTRDRDVIDRLSEILGRERAEVEGAVQGLEIRDYSWIVARNNPRRPLIVTRPPPKPRREVRTE